MPDHRTRFALLFACLLIGPASAALADPAATQPVDVLSLVAKNPAEGMVISDVTVNLAREKHREQLGQWNQAADTYQKVIDASGDRVIPLAIDEFGEASWYANFGDYVQNHLAHWPSAGMAAYRAKFEIPARKLLDSAGPEDVATLDQVYSRYFCTDAGKAAGIRLLETDMDNGDYGAAAAIGDRLASIYPDLQADRPILLYRTALAYFHSGNPMKAAAFLDDLKQQFPTQKGTVRGEEIVLADSLALELSGKPIDAELPDSWPMPAGNPSRSRISPASAHATVRLYDIPVAALIAPALPQGPMAMLADDTRQSGRTIGIMPVVDRGALFFQDGQHVHAVKLATGQPLPGWSKTYADGVYTLAGVTESARRHQLSLTLADNSVLAIMANPDQQGQYALRMAKAGLLPPVAPFVGEPRLVCLDRATGAEQWTAALSKLPDSAKDARGLQMTGSPLVIGQSVLVVAHGPPSDRGMENCNVLAFDLKTGAFRWSTFIAAHQPLTMQCVNSRSIPALQAEVAMHLAYADGRVYVQSNLGALAALDPISGATEWVDIFPIGREPPRGAAVSPVWILQRPAPIDHKPWTFNPVVVQAGRVFTMPTEGNLLHVCDAETGREINRIDLRAVVHAAPDPGSKPTPWGPISSPFDTIVGVRGDTIVLASERSVICFNWKDYDPAAAEPLKGAITKWIAAMPASIRGRAFMTADSILVPCSDRLYRLNADTGAIDSAYPPKQPFGIPGWTAPEEPGNVIAVGDDVIVAGDKSVTVYGEQPIHK